jgi:hypothetical protein
VIHLDGGGKSNSTSVGSSSSTSTGSASTSATTPGKSSATEHIPAGLVVWATGVGLHPLAAALARALPRGEQTNARALAVDDRLRVKGAEGVATAFLRDTRSRGYFSKSSILLPRQKTRVLISCPLLFWFVPSHARSRSNTML